MNEYLAECLNLFVRKQNQNLSYKTIDRKKHEIEKFLTFIEGRGITDFTDFDIDSVYEYINSLKYASQTVSGIQFTLREFFNSMAEEGKTDIDGYRIFPVIFTNKRDRILSYYLADEIKKIIQKIDVSKPNGLRDKCMILLAAQTGLRASDILSLRFKEIIWDKRVIEKIQAKTKLPVSVPLPENIVYLLIDYIRNARPASDEDYVFICRESGTRYIDSELYIILNKYIKKTDIVIGKRKHGPHALRHSLAANLLDNNTPMPVITGILGHKNINTTSRYLSIDIEGLRKASLEVPVDEK